MNYYRHADRFIKEITAYVDAEFQNMSVTARFDELTVTRAKKAVTDVYKRIRKRCRKAYWEIALAVHEEAYLECENRKFKDFKQDFVDRILAAYDPVTRYAYDAEMERKMYRLIEGIMSCKTRQEMREVLRQSASVLLKQVSQYADNVTYDAILQTFVDAGAEKVQWVTMHDEKVCHECDERDGMVFSIENLPTRHYHCRCYIVPVF